MVCVVGAGIFGEYYEEKADQDFIAVFDNVADLEIPQGSEKWCQEAWQKVHKHLKNLEKRYKLSKENY